jgi:hypothetical protein
MYQKHRSFSIVILGLWHLTIYQIMLASVNCSAVLLEEQVLSTLKIMMVSLTGQYRHQQGNDNHPYHRWILQQVIQRQKLNIEKAEGFAKHVD